MLDVSIVEVKETAGLPHFQNSEPPFSDANMKSVEYLTSLEVSFEGYEDMTAICGQINLLMF
jgi:hypothetical protein